MPSAWHRSPLALVIFGNVSIAFLSGEAPPFAESWGALRNLASHFDCMNAKLVC
jgi:hypothetical protein